MPSADLLDYLPADTPTEIVPFWIACYRWAISEPDIMRQFRRETGCDWVPATDPIGKAIDEAVGAQHAVFEQFVEWFNENVWGPLE